MLPLEAFLFYLVVAIKLRRERLWGGECVKKISKYVLYRTFF